MLTRRTALAALLALLPLASAAPAFIPPCAVTGAVQWGNWRVPLCKQFHTASTASAIRVPNDTSTTIYGTIWGPAPSWKYEFRTRTGALFKVDSGPVAPLEQAGLSGQMTTGIFKATLNSNRAIVRVEPAVFVEIGAFVHPFKGSYLSGELINSVPGSLAGPLPQGIPSKALIWINFGSETTDGGLRLRGSIANRGATNSSTPVKMLCQPLVINSQSGSYYDGMMGPGRVLFNWVSSSLDSPFDAKLSMRFEGGSTPGFTASGPKLLPLIAKPYNPLLDRYTFIEKFGMFGRNRRIELVVRKGEKVCEQKLRAL